MQCPLFARAALALCGLAAATGAAQAQVGDDAGTLGTVTVRSRRALEDRFLAAGSMVVVDRTDIEQMGVDSVGDIFRQLPGVQVTATPAGGLEVRMRGMGPQGTQLLVDGQRMGGQRGQLPLDQLPAELVERIEILRVPDAQHGGASGGTINIILRQATAQQERTVRATHARAWGRGATSGLATSGGTLGARPPPEQATADPAGWTYFLSLSAGDRLSGVDATREDGAAGAAPVRAEDRTRYRTGETAVVARLRRRLDARDQWGVSLTALGSALGGELDSSWTGGSVAAGTLREHADRDKTFWNLKMDWTHRMPSSRLEAEVSRQHGTDRITVENALRQPAGAAPAITYFIDNRAESVSRAALKLVGTQEPRFWTAGVELEERRGSLGTASAANPVNPPLQPFGQVLQRRVLWGQSEWEPWKDATLVAGLRLESLRHDIREPAAAMRRDDLLVQPSIALRAPLAGGWQWRANLARIARTPSMLELVQRAFPSQGANSPGNPDSTGNPALVPERTLTLDLGVETRVGEEGQAGIGVFQRRVSHAIARQLSEVSGRWLEQPVNLGDAVARGLEADLKTPLRGWGVDGWNLSASLTVLDSRIASGPFEGQRLPGQSRYVGTAALAKPVPKRAGWFGGASLAVAGSSALSLAGGGSGIERPTASVDAYVGSVIAGLGYWRFSVYNLADARRERQRSVVDAMGTTVISSTTFRARRRYFLTVGTRF